MLPGKDSIFLFQHEKSLQHLIDQFGSLFQNDG